MKLRLPRLVALIYAVASCVAFGSAQSATISTLYSFCDQSNCPVGGGLLTEGPDGSYYGTSESGGLVEPACSSGCGIIYKITAGNFSSLYSFCNEWNGDNCLDGNEPGSRLILGSDGNFYGVTASGGQHGAGTIFALSTSGSLTTLYSFCSESGCVDGEQPNGLTLGSDGNLYGTTFLGGISNASCPYNGSCGTLFKFTIGGSLSTIYQFCAKSGSDCPDGSIPEGDLVQGTDGNLYGTTTFGGANSMNYGTAFRVSTSGGLTTLHSFCSESGCADSYHPSGISLEASDGSFYGTTYGAGGGTGCLSGGSCGSVFKVTASGTFTSVYRFCSQGGSNCTDGIGPSALLEGSDGNFYDTTSSGGQNSAGTMFQLTSGGGIATLYDFCGGSDCAGGSDPGGLTYGSDGNFYATTTETIFQAAPSPILAPIVQVSLSESDIALGATAELNWKVLNAFSLTLQQCYAFVQNNETDAGVWTGLQPGSMVDGIFQGTSNITPTSAGVYSYVLMCGGKETGISKPLFVGGAKVSTTTTVVGPNPVTLGSIATLTASCFPQRDVGQLTGTVTFTSGGVTLGKVSLSNNSAALNVQVSEIPTGTYQVYAAYSGDGNYAGSSGHTSITVEGYETSITLTATPTNLQQGESIALASAVKRISENGTPSGTVKFYSGSSELGSADLRDGEAAITVQINGNINPGAYSVTALYSGDSTDQPATSAPVNITLVAGTHTTLTVAPNPVSPGSSVALTAQVQQTYAKGIPTGTVSFTSNGFVLGTAVVNSMGAATMNLSDVGFPAGTYPVLASYGGDRANGPSNSNIVVVVVQ